MICKPAEDFSKIKMPQKGLISQLQPLASQKHWIFAFCSDHPRDCLKNADFEHCLKFYTRKGWIFAFLALINPNCLKKVDFSAFICDLPQNRPDFDL